MTGPLPSRTLISFVLLISRVFFASYTLELSIPLTELCTLDVVLVEYALGLIVSLLKFVH